MAFAQPQWLSSEEQDFENTVYHIYVDNSFSMKRNGSEGTLFDVAKKIALEIIQSLPEQAQIQVLSNDGKPLYQRIHEPKVALDLLNRMDYQSSFQSIDLSLKRIRNNYVDEAKHEVFLISDFQNSLLDENQKPLDREQLNLIPLIANEGGKNIAIDSLAFGKPIFVAGMEQQIEVFLRNQSGVPQENISLELKLNDSLYSAQLIDLNEAPLQSISLPFLVPQGKAHRVAISIDRGQPQYDNRFYFSFQNLAARKVYLISEYDDLAGQLPFKAPLFEFRKDSPKEIDYEFFEQSDLILLQSDEAIESLAQNLTNHLRKGSNLWLLPGKSAKAFQDILARFQVSSEGKWTEDSAIARRINYNDPFFQDAFVEQINNPRLAQTKAYLKLQGTTVIDLISLSGDRPLVARKPFENAQVFFSLSRMDVASSDLAQHESFLPLLVNAALFQEESHHYFLKLGEAGGYQDFRVDESNESPLSIALKDGSIIPRQENDRSEIKVFSDELNLKPGHYPLMKDEQKVAYLALNIDKRESDLSALSLEELSDFFNDSAIIRDVNSAQDIAKIKAGFAKEDNSLGSSFIFAVLLFLSLEMILLWKRTT